ARVGLGHPCVSENFLVSAWKIFGARWTIPTSFLLPHECSPVFVKCTRGALTAAPSYTLQPPHFPKYELMPLADVQGVACARCWRYHPTTQLRAGRPGRSRGPGAGERLGAAEARFVRRHWFVHSVNRDGG